VTTEPIIDPEHLRTNVLHTRTRLEANPEGGLVRPFVDTTLLHGLSVESRWEQFGREFSVHSDEPPGRGGDGQAPTAIRYFLSGIAFCLQVWHAKGAALTGCQLGAITLRLEGSLDMRGEYGLALGAGPEYLLATTRVESPSPAGLVIAMSDEAHRRCPLWVLTTRSVPGYRRVFHNGALVLDTLPAELARRGPGDAG
jgi:hypothetical protein